MIAPTNKTGRRRFAAVAAVLAALLVGLAPGAARAHASLVASEPADGTVLDRAPEYLTLDFNEPVAPLVIRLLDPEGKEQPLGEIVQQNARVLVTVPETLAQGTHVLSWRVVSADGHPVGGTILFSIGAPSGGNAVELGSGDRTVHAAIWFVRIAIYLALFVGVGGAFFCCWIGTHVPAPVERTIIVALWLGIATAPISVGLHGLDLLARTFDALAEPSVWVGALRSPQGSTGVIAFLAAASALISLVIQSRALARALSAAALIGVGLALAASGHASTAQPQILMRTAVFLHGAGLAFWVGALLPLAGSLLWQGAAAKQALLRFSRAAPFAVLPLAASGIVLAMVQVERVDALWTTDYGGLLLCKVAALLLLSGLACWNRFWLTPRMAEGDQRARRLLVRSIGGELALVLAILAIVAAWRFTPPPRSLAAVAVAPVLVHIHTDRAMADVEFKPGRAGPVHVTIRPWTTDFAPLPAKEITLVLANPAAGIEPIDRSATQAEEGAWRIDDLTIPIPGRWQVRIDILISDFEKIMLEDTATIRP